MATENGDLEIIKYFIESNLKIRDESKRELLNIAAYEGHLHVIKYFEALDYNLHIDDDEPLQEALFGKKMNIVQYLIDKGANIRTREELFLKDSCSNNDVEVMQYLFNLYEDKAPAIKIIKRYTQKDIKDWIEKYLNALNLNNDLTNNLKENNTKTINKIKI